MRHLHKNIKRTVYIVLALLLLVQPGLAAEQKAFQKANFKAGEAAISITIESEGFRSDAYWDYQQYSIGYGTSYAEALKMFPDNEKDEKGYITLTEEQALALLKQALATREALVNGYLNRYEITVGQNQFDALLLFTYGVGEGWMTGKNSDGTDYKIRTMLEKTPAAQWTKELVHEAFGGWVNAGGQVLEGLVRRRAIEADLFLTPDGDSYEQPEEEVVFTDLEEGAWYEPFVLEANRLGIMTGRGNGIFGPDDQMSRAELVTALSKYTKPDLTKYTGSRFTDVPVGNWYTPHVEWAADQKLVNGYGDGTFMPDAKIQRERICNIIARYLRSQGVQPGLGTEKIFSDEKAMASDAIDDIYYCASLGIVNGRDDGNFDPKGEAKRSEVAKMLTGMVKVLKVDDAATDERLEITPESSKVVD